MSEYGAPVGDGTRGLVAARGQVIGRRISIPKKGEAGVELEVLLYPHSDLAGFAPCCRVESIAAAVLTIDVAYLPSSSTVTDYAGSNLTTYQFASTFPNDGGTSYFKAGDAVQLIEVDNVTPHAIATFTIVSTSPSSTPGSSTITLSGSPHADWAAIIAGGGYVELVSQDYGNGSVLTATQEAFCYVGLETTEIIGTSTDPLRRFAP